MEENRKHHSFRKGLICGVLISVLTVSVCGCGAAWMLGHLGLAALTSGGNAEEQAEDIHQDAGTAELYRPVLSV